MSTSLPSPADAPRQFSVGDAAAPPAPQNSSVAVVKNVPTTDDERHRIFTLAQTRFSRTVSTENKWRAQAREELDFVNGQHWTEEQRQERKGLPCLSFDRIGPSIDQVVNDSRQAPPAPKFIPVGGGADKETAEILQGLLRNVQNDSNSDIATETAYTHAVQIGRGWYRVLFVYENDVDFTQKIIIKRVANPFCIYPDPSADEFDYSDMRYCFATEDLDRDVFDEIYGETVAAANMGDWEALGDHIKNEWFPNGAVRVAEYWWIETERDYICMLPNGDIVPWEHVPEGVIPINTRAVEKKKVRMCKICGTGIIIENTIDPEATGILEWPGKYIPIIPVIGKEYIREGKRQLRGMIRPAMDGNLMFDFMSSKIAQGVALAPISQWKVADKAIEGYESVWSEANRSAFALLKWHAHDAEGNALPSPERISPSVDLSSAVQALSIYDNSIKAVLSTYDPSLGAPGPEQSGKAITARQREGDNAHFDYHDNYARSMRHLGRVFADLVPSIYTEARIVNIFDPDGKERQVQINAQTIYKGAQRIFSLAEGVMRFDVVADSAPNYATRRQEGVAAVTELFKFAPQVFVRAIDLFVKMLDIPFGDQIAARLAPPGVQDDDESGIPPAFKQQLDHAMQLVQSLTQALTFAESKERMLRLKLGSEERQAIIRGAAQVAAVEAKGQHDKFLSLFEAHVDTRLKLLEMNNEVANPDANPPAAQPAPSQPSPGAAPAPPAGAPGPLPPGPPGGAPPGLIQ